MLAFGFENVHALLPLVVRVFRVADRPSAFVVRVFRVTHPVVHARTIL